MPPYALTPEQEALLAISRTSWKRRGKAKELKLGFSEESVTETVLMDLAMTFPGKLAILPFNKVKEGIFGADWAWSIGNADGTAHVSMLVQAKALDFKDHAYPEIKRLVGKQTPPVRQIDLLLATAQALDMPAVYAFYNHLDDLNRLPGNCGTIPHLPHADLHEAWGITLADALQVRAILDPTNDQTFDSHSLGAQPLLCLLCSHGAGPAPPPPDAAQAAFRALQQMSMRRTALIAGEVGLHLRAPEPKMESKLAPLFAEAEDIIRDEVAERKEARTRALSEAYPQLAGVVILTDSGRD